jgi:Rps23 Pro-64 3,4-dihydroxylase Tpa1-like proline 4-hydroxylase
MATNQTSPKYLREAVADAILARLDENTVQAAAGQFQATKPTQWFSVDNLLPEEMARTIYGSFPSPADMRERKTLREHKYVAAQMDRYDPQAEEALFAFQDPRVVERVTRITGMAGLLADPKLYAGGISLMSRGNFLNPHLDNSHNNDRSLYRVLNLLYYVSPGWELPNGGHLELWPHGVKGDPLTIPSLFNRLVVMTTGPESWHSVCPIVTDAPRCCVSNYYFSPHPVGDEPYFRVTSFRGRPEQPLRDLFLRMDGKLRQAIRKLRPEGVVQTKHIYERGGERR